MENLTMYFIAVIVSFLIVLAVMKILKFIWNKILYKVLVFFRPELKNIYDFGKWIGSLFKSKKSDNSED